WSSDVCSSDLADVAVTAVDRAAHHHRALQPAESNRIFVDGSPYIHQRTDGDQRDFPWVAPNLIQQKPDRIRMRRLRKMSALRVAQLCECGLGRCRWAGGHGDVPTACFT